MFIWIFQMLICHFCPQQAGGASEQLDRVVPCGTRPPSITLSKAETHLQRRAINCLAPPLPWGSHPITDLLWFSSFRKWMHSFSVALLGSIGCFLQLGPTAAAPVDFYWPCEDGHCQNDGISTCSTPSTNQIG